LKGTRIQRKDRPVIDPLTIHEAEALIAAVHHDWGEAQGSYDEFRFFTGLRPSEQIALVVSDFDAARSTICVTKARVAGLDTDSTKTGEDRCIVLNPRALAVLRGQLAVRAELERAGKLHHDHLFFKVNARGFASGGYRPRAKCAAGLKKSWRRERDSNPEDES
jgi:integrase